MHRGDQPAGLRVVLTDHRLTDPSQPQRAQTLLLLPARTNGAAHLGDLQLRHRYAVPSRAAASAALSAARSLRARSMPAGATSSIGRPRRAATSSGRCSNLSAATVACTTLIALSLPSDLAKMSCTPAHSSTARAAPPAITPVPGLAGRSITTPAAASPCTGCVTVPPISGTRKKPLRASSTPLAIAAGTSLALP